MSSRPLDTVKTYELLSGEGDPQRLVTYESAYESCEENCVLQGRYGPYKPQYGPYIFEYIVNPQWL